MATLRFGPYRASDTMAALISENQAALLVLSRFRIPLGFADKTIGEVCAEHHVHTDTFLAIINLTEPHQTLTNPLEVVSIVCLIDYLSLSHIYFLKYRLPDIRQKLAAVLNPDTMELNAAVMKYFDKFVTEITKHMTYEDKKVFPYVKSILQGTDKPKYSLDFGKQHDKIEASLTEFKNILIKYYPAKSSNRLNNVLFDIYTCEQDLTSHNAVEDHLFLPAIAALEGQTLPPQ
jgi:regulator of cell morphogenesis and NO signaling